MNIIDKTLSAPAINKSGIKQYRAEQALLALVSSELTTPLLPNCGIVGINSSGKCLIRDDVGDAQGGCDKQRHSKGRV